MHQRVRPPEGPFRYWHPIEIRYVDTDGLGHVNNATYLSYFEAARAGYYQLLTGVPFGYGETGAALTFLIAEARIAYRAAALFGEPLRVGCRVSWASRSSFEFEYRIEALASQVGEARLIADGASVQVMYDVRASRVTRVTPELLSQFEAFEGRPIPGRRSLATG